MINQSRLKELFDYSPTTGFLTRKVKMGPGAVGSIAGTVIRRRYRQVMVDGKCYLGHRLAWLYVHGEFPSGEVDHVNGNRDDNRIENLRVVDRQGNSRNMKIRSDNSSGAVGVAWNKARGMWRARIGVNNQDIILGYFDDLDEAITARSEASKKYGFHENHGRENNA